MSLMRRDTRVSDHFCSLVGLFETVFSKRVLTFALVSLVGVTGVTAANAASSFDAPVSDRWGEFQWLSPWIETGANYREPRDGQFTLGSASFGGRWTGWSGTDPGKSRTQVEAQIAIGTRSLIARPFRYAPLSSVERPTDPALIDAFAGVGGAWGHLRVGLIPITFGLEDGDESQRDWFRPLILRRGLIGLRDIGVGYSVAAGGFYSDWYVHNGEAGEDRDREIWMTARWEYRLRTDRVAWRWGASGQVGRTAVESTHPLGTIANPNSELDPDQSSRLRFGGLHMASDWAIGEGGRGTESDRRFGFALEAFGGEVLQDIRTRRLRALRFDLEYEPFHRWGILLRGEMLDPDTQVAGDMTHELGLGFQFYALPGALKRSLRAILMVTKEWNEAPLVVAPGVPAHDVHRVEFAMRFSPNLPD